jgi:hypothetical protein
MQLRSKFRISQTAPLSRFIYDMQTPEITIRQAYADDQLALQRLASLDSARGVPPRPLLVAEVDGELRVALSVRDGTAIADPFYPTAAILGLLRGHVRANKRARRMPRRLRSARSAHAPQTAAA